MDAFLTIEAAADLEILGRLRPARGTWGFLIGHGRGPRLFVERLFPAGTGSVLPSPGELDRIDRGFGRRLVGLFAVRPSSAFREAAVGPYFCGRLILDVRFSKRRAALKLFVVEYDRKFVLLPVALRRGRKEGTP